MRELLEQVLELLPDGPVALARIVDRTGAGPRETGAAMAVTPDGLVIGSLSGGCVESSIMATADGVLRDGVASIERFAAADELAVGLPCGGEIEVFVERLDRTALPLLRALSTALRAGEAVAYATTLESAPDRALLYPDRVEPRRGLGQDAGPPPPGGGGGGGGRGGGGGLWGRGPPAAARAPPPPPPPRPAAPAG
uniref:XdhC family protein n=1 Tax=Nocardia neocaledoniensis TaxID=236511 RepID=UPI0024588D9D